MTTTPSRHHEKYTETNITADRGRTGRLDFVLDLLDLSDKSDILDIGCGPGVQFSAHVDRHRFCGVDVSQMALDEASRNGYQKVILCDLSEGLPLEAQSQDVVVLTDILEHLIEPDRLLLEAKRVLRPGGVAVVSVPNHFYLWNRLRILRGKGLILPWANHQEYEDWNYFHYRFFRWQSLQSLLAHTGFTLVHDLTDRFPAPWPNRWWMRGTRRLLRGVRRATSRRWRDLWTLHLLVVCNLSLDARVSKR